MNEVEKLMVLADLQLKTSSIDAYNLGLYNGILSCIALLSREDTRVLNLSQFEKLQKQLLSIG